MNRKGNIIIGIGDGVTTLLAIKGFYIFNDNWITKYDTLLFDDDGNEYNVLDYYETEDYVCDEILFTDKEINFPINRWKERKRTCLKLDKKVYIGKMLYVKKDYEQEKKDTTEF
jgi:hypothetical protein